MATDFGAPDMGLDPTTMAMGGADPGLLEAVARPSTEGKKVYDREPPEVDPKRKAMVEAICRMVRQGKNHWDKTFRRMEKDQRFAAGHQWPEETKIDAFNDDKDDLYIANITLRHISQKVASTYAKNPKAVYKRRPRMLATVWDGSMQTLAQAAALLQQAQQAQQMIQAGVMMGLASAASGVPISAIPAAMAGSGDPGMAPGPAAPGAPPPAGDLSMPPGGVPGGAPPGANGVGGLPGAAPGGGSPIMPGMPQMPPPEAVQEATLIVQDAQMVKATIDQLNKIGRTLQLLYEYEIDEQQQPFKSMMKMSVRRACTSGVSWVKLGFQRVMQPSPDKDSRIADIQAQLDLIARISGDIADGETQIDSAEAEQLRLTLQSIQGEQDIVVREGLQFSWPKPTAIIPDPRTVQLRDFLGAGWVAEEYCLTPNEVQETYGVDVRASYTAYNRSDTGTDYERAYAQWQQGAMGPDEEGIGKGDSGSCLVWELYNKRDGLVHVVCDGWPDFLREPAPPEVYTDRFWPWFLVAFNECEGQVYPPSDVKLVKPMQLELNRSRQGLREHRFANRPKTAYAEGALSEEDIAAFQTHPVNALIAVSGLQPGQDINSVITGVKGVPVDPNLYEVNPIFQDLLRVVGDQQADLGGTAGGTATETNIAASARATATGSNVDDIDDTLTALARASSQILLLNVSEDTVKEIVGPGAVWPQLTKAQVAKDIYLDIQAGSSGRPNQAQELQNFERLAPTLMQLPGITPTWMAKQAITRLDDNIDVDEAIADGAPSILQMNGIKPGASESLSGGQAPGAQGPQGVAGPPGPQPPGPSPSSPTPKPPQQGLPN